MSLGRGKGTLDRQHNRISRRSSKTNWSKKAIKNNCIYISSVNVHPFYLHLHKVQTFSMNDEYA